MSQERSAVVKHHTVSNVQTVHH